MRLSLLTISLLFISCSNIEYRDHLRKEEKKMVKQCLIQTNYSEKECQIKARKKIEKFHYKSINNFIMD